MEDYFLISIWSFAQWCIAPRKAMIIMPVSESIHQAKNQAASNTAIALNFYPYSDVLIPPGGCGVAWYPTGFGSLRLRSKSGQPHVIQVRIRPFARIRSFFHFPEISPQCGILPPPQLPAVTHVCIAVSSGVICAQDGFGPCGYPWVLLPGSPSTGPWP